MDHYIFTYGTLMKDRYRSSVLDEAEYTGDAVLENHALLELGAYPGAVFKEGSKVFGEVYRISEEKKRELDYIEGEGYLYKYEYADVVCNGRKLKVGFYRYLRDDGSHAFFEEDGKWHD